MKRALVLGIGGQDGSYLAEVLLEKDYEVHGMIRRSATGNTKNIQHLIDSEKITLHRGDMADPLSVADIVRFVEPQEIYNEADQDNVDWSRAVPSYNYDITAGAVGRLLEIVHDLSMTQAENVKVFQPVSAMMFGDAPFPQTEETRFNPLSPYACAKVAAYYLCRYYRQVYGLFVSTAIMYNHDSVRRSEEYLLHKICASAVRIYRGEQEKLVLGDLDVPVDIGSAREYMEAAYSMMQLSQPGDFILASGKGVTIRDLVDAAFTKVGLEYDQFVKCEPSFNRPGPKHVLVGYNQKARDAFGFAPKCCALTLIPKLIEHYSKREEK